MKIQVLMLDKHGNVVGFHFLIGSQPLALDVGTPKIIQI
jgi:hypothetical protein